MSREAGLVLDTHVWVWMVEARSDLIKPAAKREIQRASDEGRLIVSAISVWEVAMLAAKARLTLSVDVGEWVSQALAAPGLQLVELLPEISIDSTRLPASPPSDPADRMLIATARYFGAKLVTADAGILEYAARTKAMRVVKVR